MIRSEAFGPLDNSHYQAYVGNICDAGEKLLASFSQILEFAELEGGRKTMHQERFSVDALLEATRNRFKTRALQNGIRLRLGERVSGALNADRECVERMLNNIMDNALRFTPRGGEVKLAAWQAEDGVVLEITDTGEGMDTEKLGQISQPFVLPDATFTRDHDGPGLGIAMARAIAELSGGNLVIDSVAGVGTTVAIVLPIEASSETETGSGYEARIAA